MPGRADGRVPVAIDTRGNGIQQVDESDDEELKKEKLKQEREQNLWNNTQQYNIGRNDWTLVNCRDNSG